jgi:arylsulfatase A-like enzyme
MGYLIDGPMDYPGYDAHIPFEKATSAEVLKENGYNTIAVGKWHITPYEDITQAGPFNRWPTGRGFEHYYGFLSGETDEYVPQLWENTAKIEPDTKGKQLTTLLVDKAISYIADQKSAAPEKPFFLYFATGAGHAPHQVDASWINMYKGKFDKGWDVYREQVLAQQKKSGVVPADAILPPRNPGIKAWDSLSGNEKKLFSRFMEAYAGFVSHTDHEIGRLINYLKTINQLDNTLIIAIIGDNGASKEGGLPGVTKGVPEMVYNQQSYADRIQSNLKLYEQIGLKTTSVNYPTGWAMAANTPFKYWKQDANSEGGTRNPLIIFYPEKIKEKGGIRKQYSHINSIWPTTAELTGITLPQVLNGYKQEPLEGTSLAYTLNDAQAPDKHLIQYYELSGSRSIYKDGFKAEAYHKRELNYANDVWELYNLKEDFNERINLAEKYPEKLAELQELFDREAYTYNVYPLRETAAANKGLTAVKNTFNAKTKIVLYGGSSQFHTSSFPRFVNRAYSLTANVELNKVTDEGVLFALGGQFNGLSFYIKDSKLQVAHNVGTVLSYLEATGTITPGKAVLRYEFNYNSSSSQAGTEALYINEVKVAEKQIDKATAFVFEYDEGLDVGRDNQSPVTNRYKAPFAFTGKLNTLTVEFK